ncbi:uncharacterized protein LOC135848214 [Planococcus citri]|uniref:uncharacterized protein LOC135848214 n=1 Tax=Planococcus citri TaxID=170843 RepID=UPI0031F8E6CD
MRIKPMTYAIAAMILIETNFLICTITNADDLQKLTSQIVPSTNFKTTSNSPDIQPLPWKTFTEELSELLSPDIFSSANPFTHLLIKVIKLPYDTMNRIMDQIFTSLLFKKFPQQYIPFAKLVTSIINCLYRLERVKKITPLLQNSNQTNYLYKPLDILISAIDPELSPLFSSYILSDKNPPFRVLIKLLTIPENDLPSIKIHLKDLFKNRLFPRRYFGFVESLQIFLGQEHILQHLKKSIAEVQPTTLMENLSTQIKGTLEDVEFGLQAYDPSNADSTLTSQHLKQAIADSPNNDQAGYLQSGKTVSPDAMKFLSPRMFSTTDPVTYVLNKARKLDPFTIRITNSILTSHLDDYEFPQEYIPYAELVSSLLSCLCGLEVVSSDIKDIRRNIINNRFPKKNDIFTPDPELSKLFSPQIMSKVPNPSINILRIFIDIPENEISNLPTRLKIIQDDARFPRQYRDYSTHLGKFLEDNQCLLRIKDEIAEIRRVLTFNSSNSNNQQVPWVRNNFK